MDIVEQWHMREFLYMDYGAYLFKERTVFIPYVGQFALSSCELCLPHYQRNKGK